jgi:hypothetical protein
MARTIGPVTATSASWKVMARAWRTTRAPILISLSCKLVSDQSAMASGKRMAVVAVGRDDAVARGEGCGHAHGDRLLSVVKMQEAADLFLGVKLEAGFLEAADPDHVAQERAGMVVVEPDARS